MASRSARSTARATRCIPVRTARRHDAVTRKTIKLASLIGDRARRHDVGLPRRSGRLPTPTGSRPPGRPRCRPSVAYQWDEVLIPYWRRPSSPMPTGLASASSASSCTAIRNVYSVETFRRLRDAVGDTRRRQFRSEPPPMDGRRPARRRSRRWAMRSTTSTPRTPGSSRASPGVNGRLETKPSDLPQGRAWNYVTLGYGNGEAWWRRFCASLKMAGYNDVLSIEHEDMLMPPLEGVEKFGSACCARSSLTETFSRGSRGGALGRRPATASWRS